MPSPKLPLPGEVGYLVCVAACMPCPARYPKRVARPQLLRPACCARRTSRRSDSGSKGIRDGGGQGRPAGRPAWSACLVGLPGRPAWSACLVGLPGRPAWSACRVGLPVGLP